MRDSAELKHIVSLLIEIHRLWHPAAASSNVIVPGNGSKTKPPRGEKKFTMQAFNLILFSDLGKSCLEIGLISFIVGQDALDISALSFMNELSISVNQEPNCGAKPNGCAPGDFARTA